MAEYIDRKALDKAMTIAAANGKDKDRRTWAKAICVLHDMPIVDAVPVVRCKDCEYSYDEISYLCCSHGVCVDCEVPPSFYCAYGKRRAEKEPPEEGEI